MLHLSRLGFCSCSFFSCQEFPRTVQNRIALVAIHLAPDQSAMCCPSGPGSYLRRYAGFHHQCCSVWNKVVPSDASFVFSPSFILPDSGGTAH
ncbi:hypothetical protein VTI74DRAFT_2142 [Chaetomium olivicolor]